MGSFKVTEKIIKRLWRNLRDFSRIIRSFVSFRTCIVYSIDNCLGYKIENGNKYEIII